MKYILEVNFEGEKHCLQCPLRNKSNDSCNLQSNSNNFDTFDNQLKNCPLKLHN